MGNYFTNRLNRCLSEAIPIAKFKQIKQAYRKQGYKPGTFGIEIEFKALPPKEEWEIDDSAIADKLRRNRHFISYFNDDIWPEPEDARDWYRANPEPEVEAPNEADFDDEDAYNDACYEYEVAMDEHDLWQQELAQVEQEYERWQEKREDMLDETVNSVIDEQQWEQFGVDTIYIEPNSEVYNDVAIGAAIRTFQENGIPAQQEDPDANSKTWGIGPDGSLVEVRSPPLTTADIPQVKLAMHLLGDERFDGGTSAHVHIGLPANIDSFDLLALTTLTDEEEVQKYAGKGREFDQWAKLRPALADRLYELLPNGDMFQDELIAVMQQYSKYFGTNILAWLDHGTVEFRYLSSQILEDVDSFLKWIQYFLLMPRIAQSRKTIQLTGNVGTLIITRLPGGHMRIMKQDKYHLSNGRIPENPLPPSELRKADNTAFSNLAKWVLKRYGDMLIADDRIIGLANMPSSSNAEDKTAKRLQNMVRGWATRPGSVSEPVTLRQAWAILGSSIQNLLVRRMLKAGMIPMVAAKNPIQRTN